jgi:polysaccharide export outer membrane protein
MNKVLFFKNFKFLVAFMMIGLASSCVSSKRITYFKNISVDSTGVIAVGKFIEPTILPDDILAISIFTTDLSTGGQVNQLNSQTIPNSNNQPPINGFLVDNNGEVDLPIIGKVKLLGLTTFQARDLISSKASADYKDPSVQVRFANFKVTVMGEVSKPAIYTLPNEKVTIMDALSLAGDLTLYGKRENILVIREIDGKKHFGRLNLQSSEVFSNPYYYLRQNDIIYIEPVKAKASALSAPTRGTIGITLSAISILALAITRLF